MEETTLSPVVVEAVGVDKTNTDSSSLRRAEGSTLANRANKSVVERPNLTVTTNIP